MTAIKVENKSIKTHRIKLLSRRQEKDPAPHPPPPPPEKKKKKKKKINNNMLQCYIKMEKSYEDAQKYLVIVFAMTILR